MSTAPTWYPVMIVVVALLPLPARACSVTSAIAVGRQPPSPRPAKNRNRPKTNADGATAHSSVNSEKLTTDSSSARRLPMTSVIVPMVSAPIVMPTRPSVDSTVAVPGSSPHTLSRNSTGNTVPSTTRSKPSSRTAVQHKGTAQARPRSAVTSGVDMHVLRSAGAPGLGVTAWCGGHGRPARRLSVDRKAGQDMICCRSTG